MQRQLGLVSATALVVGEVIGVGIFLAPAGMAQSIGSPGWLLVTWLAIAVLSLCGALCYGELAMRFPVAGGGYVYLREGFGRLPAFLYGWKSLLVIATGACAAVAYTFATYFAALFGLGEASIRPIAVIAIAILSVVNILGVGKAAVTQNLFT